MKALYFSKHGDTENLLFGELPPPQPAAGEVLIRVKACALNHLDLWVLRGWPGLKLALPHIGGSDIVGTVESCGEGVSLALNSRVALLPGFIKNGFADEWTVKGEESLSPEYQIFGETRPGGFSELLVAPAETLLSVPENLTDSQAAAPLLVSTTAWRMLKHRAKVEPGESVLIVGGGGGLNSFSITLAKDLGAKVIVLTSSESKAKRARELGADETINYLDTPDWSRAVKSLTAKRGVDVVVDNVGKPTYPLSLASLARGGRLVTVGNTAGYEVNFDNRLIFGKQLSILGSTMGSTKDAKEAISYAWQKGPQRWIDREMPLAEGRRAYEELKLGSQSGKIILRP